MSALALKPFLTHGPLGNRVSHGPDHHSWKGMNVPKKCGGRRARRLFEIVGPCELCRKRATDRHHRDGNPLNNDPNNLQALCRKCHMVSDGRLARFKQLASAPKAHSPKRPCENCGTPSKPLRKGRCHKCTEFFRRNGAEWTAERANRSRKRGPDRFCQNCTRFVASGWSKGRCPACRLYFTAHGTERPIQRRTGKEISVS